MKPHPLVGASGNYFLAAPQELHFLITHAWLMELSSPVLLPHNYCPNQSLDTCISSLTILISSSLSSTLARVSFPNHKFNPITPLPKFHLCHLYIPVTVRIKKKQPLNPIPNFPISSASSPVILTLVPIIKKYL